MSGLADTLPSSWTRMKGVNTTRKECQPTFSGLRSLSPAQVCRADGTYETFEEASKAAASALLEVMSSGFTVTHYSVKRTKAEAFRMKVCAERTR